MELKDLLKITQKAVRKNAVHFTATIDTATIEKVKKVCSLIAAAAPLPQGLGGPQTMFTNVLAALYQDDDAHEDCSLTACLNPLHPGPCKGWKGTLHEVSPGAWHTLEAARVEKANHTRVKKIEALKAQGKPIPHKLLQPIVAKPNPQAGQTAKNATGEAHAAGKAVSDAAGIVNNHPGKVSLGQAVKAAPVEKGPKGKKPTLGSKGIAFVIGQEKVTPQYKLDKAAAITPEQWAGLPEADKASIRGELAKIQKDGFGPQQKKATELLDKLDKPEPPKPLKSGTPGTITTPSGKVYQKISLKEIHEGPSPKAPSPVKAEPPKTPTKLSEIATPKTAVTTGGKPKPLPKHVEDAISMAKGHAPGASWSKNHLAAYQPLSAEEFHALPKEHQDKIVSELTKGQSKFLDPKKIAASKALLEKFGHGESKKPEAPKGPEKPVSFATHLHDHSVTQAQAKAAVEKVPVNHLFTAAKHMGVVTDPDNPDLGVHALNAADDAKAFVDLKTYLYDSKILGQPGVQAAIDDLHAVAVKQAFAQSVGNAKAKAFNKINLALAPHGGGMEGLSPIERATLQHYQKHLVGHPVKTDTATMDALKADTKQAEAVLLDKLHAAVKQANAPKPENMSPAQIADRAKELLGDIAAEPKVSLSGAETKHADNTAKVQAAALTKDYPDDVLTDPVVAAKFGDLTNATFETLAIKGEQHKLDDHLKVLHHDALKHGSAADGAPLTADDKKVIGLHAEQLKADHAYLDASLVLQEKKLADAKAAFHAAATKAQANLKPAEPHKLTNYDEAAILQGYSTAWSQHASKAVKYGVSTLTVQTQMKAHQSYIPLTQDLADLKELAGELALAHAEEHTAGLNVPTNPVTGDVLAGPEKAAWDAAKAHRVDLEQQFAGLHKVAQARLDKIRVNVGLKKRALPKADAPAVKAQAAEHGYYKSSGYSGPNYGKPAAAKNYMLAKVGPKHAVVHKSASEKKTEKLGAAAAKKPSTSKIENVEPVKLGGGAADTSIAHLPATLKGQITSDFKAMPNGKFLSDPTEDIFGNLVTLAAAHGKNLPGGLSVDQVLKTIDETHSKNLGVSNSGMLHAKVTDWLGTGPGKAYAEAHSTPDSKAVKKLTGEVDLPKGVSLAPGEKVQPLAGPGAHDKGLTAKDFHAHTAAEAQAEQDAYKKAQGITWTAGQKKAMTAYTGNGSSAYDGINNYLRGSGGYDQVVKQYAVDIQSAMMPLRENTLLKRGTGWPPGIASFKGHPEDLLGKTFEDKGFVSSSVAGSGGHFSGQPLQLVIEAPKGTPAVFVNGISKYKDSENEMLLAAGTKFKVLSVEQTSGGHTLLRVRVVGDK
jgi:hypothetical protein